MVFEGIEVKFDEIVNIDLSNKPSRLKKINPEEKVPVINIEGKIIAESFVLLELAHDLKPENSLPTDIPLLRAKLDLFYTIPAYIEYVEIYNNRLDEMIWRQSSTSPHFLCNDYSLADITIAPFIVRNLAVNKGLLDGYMPKPITDKPRLQEFVNCILNRPSFKKIILGMKLLLLVSQLSWVLNPLRVLLTKCQFEQLLSFYIYVYSTKIDDNNFMIETLDFRK